MTTPVAVTASIVRVGAHLMARSALSCVCTTPGRSHMSRAFFDQDAAGRHEADSAGTTPAERVHPVVVYVMRELDIDIADRVPQKLTTDLAEWACIVVTMEPR